MRRVAVASKNRVKVEAARAAFQAMFPDEAFELIGFSVESGVSSQPLSNEETLRGAMNRAEAVSQLDPGADYWVGVEGGLHDSGDEIEAFAWAVVKNRDRVGKARTASFFLPPEIISHIHDGKELSEADDLVFNRQGSRHSEGAVGLLTGGLIDRTTYHETAVLLALIPFKNPTLYR